MKVHPPDVNGNFNCIVLGVLDRKLRYNRADDTDDLVRHVAVSYQFREGLQSCWSQPYGLNIHCEF